MHSAYVLAASTCRADFSQDGIRDGADIAAFVEAFLAGDPVADLAIPFGLFDSRDIERFLDLYEMIPGFAVGFLVTFLVSRLTAAPEGAAAELEEMRKAVGGAFTRP